MRTTLLLSANECCSLASRDPPATLCPPTGESQGRRLTLPPPTIPKKSTMHARRGPKGGSMGGVPPLWLLPRTVPCLPSQLFVAVDAVGHLKALRGALAQFGDIGGDHLLQRPAKDAADQHQV